MTFNRRTRHYVVDCPASGSDGQYTIDMDTSPPTCSCGSDGGDVCVHIQAVALEFAIALPGIGMFSVCIYSNIGYLQNTLDRGQGMY